LFWHDSALVCPPRSEMSELDNWFVVPDRGTQSYVPAVYIMPVHREQIYIFIVILLVTGAQLATL
jgi:hypothetical protein